MSRNQSFVTVEVACVVKTTDAAMLFRILNVNGNKGWSDEWVPKSLMEDEGDGIEEDDEEIEVNVAEWFAVKEGLV